MNDILNPAENEDSSDNIATDSEQNDSGETSSQVYSTSEESKPVRVLSDDTDATAPPVAAPQPSHAPSNIISPISAPPQGASFGNPIIEIQEPVPGQQFPNDFSRARQKKRSSTSVGALLLVALLAGGVGGAGIGYVTHNMLSSSSSVSLGSAPININNPDKVSTTTAVADKASRTVVTIHVRGSSSAGTGSGVILSEDGYIITNNHVATLDGAAADASISVVLQDGRVFPAEIVGTAPYMDIAVIKLKGASGLTSIEWGDSSKLNVGEKTVAIGAPLNLPGTVTDGVISTLYRSIQVLASIPNNAGQETQSDESTQSPWNFDIPGQINRGGQSTTISLPVIQTDASINQGNSGGALLNTEGKLVGIVAAIASPGTSSGEVGSVGLGFAIPGNVAKRLAEDIITTGQATHGLLGATARDVDITQSPVIGSKLVDINPDSPAQKAGLQSNDIVTAVNGIPITKASDLTAQIRSYAPQTTVQITFVRDGKIQNTEATLDKL